VTIPDGDELSLRQEEYIAAQETSSWQHPSASVYQGPEDNHN
jgi:hypothetical protein